MKHAQKGGSGVVTSFQTSGTLSPFTKKTNCSTVHHSVDTIPKTLCTGHTHSDFPSCGLVNTSLFYKIPIFGHATVPTDRLLINRVFNKLLIILNIVLTTLPFPSGSPNSESLWLLFFTFSLAYG